jgi:hypothetical protein
MKTVNLKTIKMKTIIILITLIIATTTTSCEKDTATICENLLEQGSTDATLLKGEWELEYFARTLNGKNYRWEAAPSFQTDLNFNDTTFRAGVRNVMYGNYYVDEQSNEISFMSTLITEVGVTEEQGKPEDKYFNSIKNSVCFVIVDGNKLMIHYKEANDGKNILIFNKKIKL